MTSTKIDRPLHAGAQMSEDFLPLFPLDVVLFPRSSLPLHIFEERYKILVDKCVREGKEFGINLVHDGTFAEVGCTAGVTKVLRRYEDGRLDIVVEGRRRYILPRYDTGSSSYLVGVVEYLSQPQEKLNEILAHETVELHKRVIAIVYGDALPPHEFVAERPNLTFALAQKVGMDLGQRQRLLDLSLENERLEFLHSYLIEIMPKLEKLSEIERVIRSDGNL